MQIHREQRGSWPDSADVSAKTFVKANTWYVKGERSNTMQADLVLGSVGPIDRLFVVLRFYEVLSSAVSLPNHTFTGQA